MPEKNIVTVDLDKRSYDIHIGRDVLDTVVDSVPLALQDRTLFIVTDENVEKKHAARLQETLRNHSGASAVEMLVLPPGEQTKSFDLLQHILSWLFENGVNRQSVIFATGGGVIGDLAGFAAAIIMRGVPFVQVPTTLLAQVDSSVGGKTAVNMPYGKNLAGAFYQPVCVLCDIGTLETLPRRELLAGYAEIVKYGLINDPEFFMWLETNGAKILDLDQEPLVHAINVSCRKKAEIVKEDEREQGARALLNFGHTFAHMLERAANYDDRLLHGEAVSIGMVMAFHLSVRLGICKENDLDNVKRHLQDAGLPVSIADIREFVPDNIETLQKYLQYDKKVTTDGLVFILTRGIGKAFIHGNVAEEDVRQVIKHSLDGH